MQNEGFVCFAFLRRRSTRIVREMTSSKQRTSDQSSATEPLSDLGTRHRLNKMGQNTLFCRLSLCISYLAGSPPADTAALKRNSLRDKQKFSRLAKLSTLMCKLSKRKRLIVSLLISNGKILIFVWKNTGGWLYPSCNFVSKRSVQIYINGMCLLPGRRFWGGWWLKVWLAKLSPSQRKVSDERILTHHKPRLQQYIQRMQPTKGIHH